MINIRRITLCFNEYFLYITNNSKKGFKNVNKKYASKKYIKNKDVFSLLKEKILEYEGRKYPVSYDSIFTFVQ